MSQKDYNAKLKAVTAIRDEDVKQPNMPVGEAVQQSPGTIAKQPECFLHCPESYVH